MKIIAVWIAVLLAAIALCQQVDRDALAQEMNSLKTSDWQAGFAFGQKLADLPNGVGFEIMRDNWNKGASIEARKQMFKGYVFSDHPDTLKVLNLGATDPDLSMQNWSFEYLKSIAFVDFAEDYSAYLTWAKKYVSMPLAQVRTENFKRFMTELAASKGEEREHFYRRIGRMSFPKGQSESELALQVIRDVFTDPKATQDGSRAASALLSFAKPSEGFLKEVVLPSIRGNNPELVYASIRALAPVKGSWVDDAFVALLKEAVGKPGMLDQVSFPLGEGFAERKNLKHIPLIIGAIVADNTSASIYGLGYFALAPLTGVSYDPSHNGAWWKDWWAKNKQRYPEDVRTMEIPSLATGTPPPAQTGVTIKEGDPAALLVADVAAGRRQQYAVRAEQIAKDKDYSAIPTMIAAIVADEGYESVYGIGYFGLTPLTGVTYDPSHDGKWWTAWWGKNKSRFNEGVRGLSVPVLKAAPKPDPATYVPDDPDVADIPTTNYYADTAKNMRYIVSGPVPNAPAPAGGWKLIVVLPGGDGSVDFHPFLKRVLRGAMPRDFLLVQLVAKKWSADQFDKIVWPTKSNPWKGMEFSTEEFIEAAITDVKKHYNVDASHIYGMGWSSSGPPLYAHMMSGSKSFAGTFIAMSVFWPDSLPKVDHIKGYPVYILHSPQDFIQMSHPENAVKALTEAGAKVKFETYQGGHGWHGDTFGMIRAAFEWLQDPK